MPRLIKCSLYFTLLSSIIFSSFAKESTIKIRTLSFPPFGIVNQEGYSGIYYDMANLITEHAGLNTYNSVIPYARIIREMKYGQADLSIMFRYPSLENEITYITPLPAQEIVVIGLKGTSYSNISDLAGKQIISIRGAKLDNRIDNDKSILKRHTKDYIQCIKMLMAGKVDAIVGSLLPIKAAALHLNENGNEKIQFDSPLIITTKTPWLQISKQSILNNESAINKLKQSFYALEKEGRIKHIKDKYIQSNLTKSYLAH